MSVLDLVGKKYNRLTVIKRVENINNMSVWECKCDCGNIKNIIGQRIVSNNIKSCGCLKLEHSSKLFKEMVKRRTKYTPIEASAREVWKKRYINDGGNLSFEDFMILTQMGCFYCGSPPENIHNASLKNSSEKFKEENEFSYNGLDRIKNDRLHDKDNVVPCCKYCNYAKRELGVKEFSEWIKFTYNHSILEKGLDQK